MKFSQIINPVSELEHAELFRVQRTTLDSIAESRRRCHPEISTELIAVTFPGSVAGIENQFDKTIYLDRSVADVHRFARPRKLPLIYDLLSKGVAAADGDYVIFTNTDIALMPDFYNVVAWYIGKGHDALVINRRRIPLRLQHAPLEVMEAHAGEIHTGYDCFVFKKELFSQFIPSQVCIGVPPAGNDIFHNLFTFAKNPALLTEQHLTFHLGLDLVKEWGSREFLEFNYKEFHRMLAQLKPQIDITKFPGASLPFFVRHFKWLMNPTFHYPTMLSLDLNQLGKKRKKRPEPEIPGARQSYYEWMIRKINFKEEE